MRPHWDCITKDLWYKAYRIMRKARNKTAFEMIKYDKVIYFELQNTFQEYSARLRGVLCDYFLNEFYKPIHESRTKLWKIS